MTLKLLIAVDECSHSGIVVSLPNIKTLEEYSLYRDRFSSPLCMAYVIPAEEFVDLTPFHDGDRVTCGTPQRLLRQASLPPFFCHSEGSLAELCMDLLEKYGICMGDSEDKHGIVLHVTWH